MTNQSSNSTPEYYKNLLIYRAFEVESLLKRYVIIHDNRLKRGGSFISLFKNIFFNTKVGFDNIYLSIDTVCKDCSNEITALELTKNDYPKFTKSQQNFYDILIIYSKALLEAIKSLRNIAEKQCELSSSRKKSNLTLKTNLKQEKIYKGRILEYLNLGGKLSIAFQELKSENFSL